MIHRGTYRVFAIVWATAILVLLGIVLAWTVGASARDNGFLHWSSEDQLDPTSADFKIRRWFQTLMQPDNPRVSCCGESDAYEADSFEVEGDHYIAIITHHRGVTTIPLGTRILVPNSKLKYDSGNPSGHGIIFIGSAGQVFCYVVPGGV